MNPPAKDVSVVIPCWNERDHIGPTLDSLLVDSIDDPGRMEVLVVDGMSDDGTRDIVTGYAERYPGIVRLVDNPERFTPFGLNAGVRASTSERVIIINAHTIYPDRFVQKLLEGIEEHGADMFGGITVAIPRNDSAVAIALAHVQNDSFGMSGGFRGEQKEETVKPARTVPMACYRKELFDRFGLFNEKLTRGQDRELNERMAAGGAKILIDPSIKMRYKTRSDLWTYAKWLYRGGYWVFYLPRFTDTKIKRKSNYVPLLFVLYLAGLLLGWRVFPRRWRVLGSLPLLAYLGLGARSALTLYRSSGRTGAALLAMAAFLATHVPYGAGSLVGLVKLLRDGKLREEG